MLDFTGLRIEPLTSRACSDVLPIGTPTGSAAWLCNVPNTSRTFFFLTKGGFIKAIVCGIAATFLWLGNLERSVHREALH